MAGTKPLYLLGYVEYLDRFDTRHRGKFAREFRPGLKPNNLTFVTQEGYNDDVDEI
jgi:hypothetical protein